MKSWSEGETDRQIDREEREERVKEAVEKGEGLRDAEMRARLRACRAGEDGSW